MKPLGDVITLCENWGNSAMYRDTSAGAIFRDAQEHLVWMKGRLEELERDGPIGVANFARATLHPDMLGASSTEARADGDTDGH